MNRKYVLQAYVALTILAGMLSLFLVPFRGVDGRVGVLVVFVALVGLISLIPVKLEALRVEFTATHPVMVAALGAVGGWGAGCYVHRHSPGELDVESCARQPGHHRAIAV